MTQPGPIDQQQDGSRAGGLGDGQVSIVHLFVLSSFAVAQPILDLIARNPTFLVAHRSQTSDVLVIIAILVFLVPLPLVAVEVIARSFGRKTQAVTHLVLVSVLAGAIVLPPLKRASDLSAVPLIGLALLIGALFGFLYFRSSGVQRAVTWLVLAIPVFSLVFLANPSVSKLVFGSSGATGAGSVGTTTPVVFVVFDELPLTALLDSHGQIDPVRYPNLARLANEATWYRDATTVAAFTHLALPSIVTGRYPEKGKGPTSVDYPDNLFSLFGTSHRIDANEPLTMLCPEDLSGHGEEIRLGARLQLAVSDLILVFAHVFLPEELADTLPPVDQGWDHFAEATDIGSDDAWSQEWGTRRLFDRKAQFVDFIDGIAADEPPTFHFLHVLLPHPPMSYLPSGKIYSVDGGIPGLKRGSWSDDDWTVLQNYQRFLLQTGFVDSLVGRLVARLRETGLFDPCLLVVTADHGISFHAGDSRRKFTETNYQDILPVPLIIKAPHQRVGTVNFDNVETVDILPVIADILGIEVPWELDGLASSRERSTRFGKSVPEGLSGSWSGHVSMEDYRAAYDGTLQRKLEEFGSGGVTDRLLKIGPYPSLLGRPPDELLTRKAGGIEAAINLPLVSGSLDLDEDFIPAHVTGSLKPMGRVEGPVDLAVVINNVIRATTTTRRTDRKRSTLFWSAVVDESSFVNGENEYALFLIDADNGKISLRETELRVHSPAVGTIPFGINRVLGVKESGFYPTGLGAKSRWTTGFAELVIPISRQSPPEILRVEIIESGPNGTRLKIEVNSQSIFDSQIQPGGWARDFDISKIATTDELMIELSSDTFQKGDRSVGIAVEGIWLKNLDD